MTTPRLVGPRSRQIVEREARHIAAGLQSYALYSGLAMARGTGCTLIDEDGNEYVDFMAGIGVGSVGHCHPRYVEALKRQVEQLTFGSFATETRARFLELLAKTTPAGLARTIRGPSHRVTTSLPTPTATAARSACATRSAGSPVRSICATSSGTRRVARSEPSSSSPSRAPPAT